MASTIFGGKEVSTNGDVPQPGDIAPDFTLTANDLSTVSLSDSDGKIRIISVVPSIDTSVCSIQTARFNKELDTLPDSVVGYTVSVDTPFAQKRWCGAEGVEKMKLLSDFKGQKFLKDYGLYLEDLGLSARAVIIVDSEGKVAYSEVTSSVGQEPDYQAALDKLRELSA